jgi:hypothetical protein
MNNMANKPIIQNSTLTDENGVTALSVATGGAVTLGPAGGGVTHTVNGALACPATGAVGDGAVGTLSAANVSILNHNSNGAATIAGLSGGVYGQVVYITNRGSSAVTLTHTLSAGNYFICPSGVNFVIPAYGAVCVIFINAWYVISK